jgi:hypothetical protein
MSIPLTQRNFSHEFNEFSQIIRIIRENSLNSWLNNDFILTNFKSYLFYFVNIFLKQSEK